jgi:hypothetical protein
VIITTLFIDNKITEVSHQQDHNVVAVNGDGYYATFHCNNLFKLDEVIAALQTARDRLERKMGAEHGEEE